MKYFVCTLIFCSLINFSFAQNQWFQTYTDSIALVKDANLISEAFITDIRNIKSDFKFEGNIILDTSPYLIYYGFDKNVHLSLWEQVLPEIKSFFVELSGSETEGKTMFGLFFNGFYLPHELGHALQDEVDGTLEQSYKSEYFANTIAMLWLRKHGYQKELEQCYNFAKAMESKLPNPVPDEESIEDYFTHNYNEASKNPYSYGYMQFKQFVEVYEDEALVDFDTFMKNYLYKKQ
jgi:hypothetical protein